MDCDKYLKNPRMKRVVLNILHSHAAQRTHFFFAGQRGRVAVSGETFRRVARAIESGRVCLSDDLTNIRAGAGGSYSTTNNIIFAPPPHNHRTMEATIIHEAVHASFDLTHSDVTDVDEEMAAYIAQCIYLMHRGYSFRDVRGSGDELYEDALRVARGLTGHALAYTSVATGRIVHGAINPDDLERLRQSVLNDKFYYDYLLGRKAEHGEFVYQNSLRDG